MLLWHWPVNRETVSFWSWYGRPCSCRLFCSRWRGWRGCCRWTRVWWTSPDLKTTVVLCTPCPCWEMTTTLSVEPCNCFKKPCTGAFLPHSYLNVRSGFKKKDFSGSMLICEAVCEEDSRTENELHCFSCRIGTRLLQTYGRGLEALFKYTVRLRAMSG